MLRDAHIRKSISNILAIRLSGIGDVILLLPALAELRTSFGGARLTLLTGAQCAPVAELSPHIDGIVVVDRKRLQSEPKLKAVAEIWKLIGAIRERRFDLVVDFHSLKETNLLAWLSRAPHRVGLKRSKRGYLGFCFTMEPAVQDETLHIRDMFRLVAENIAGVGTETLDPTPLIEAPAAARDRALRLRPPGPCIALNVGASRARRRWPASRFGAVAAYAVRRLGASVMVVGGASPEEEELARNVREAAGDSDRIRLANGLSFSEVVAVIECVDLLVSNDTAAMHVGPAMGTPTIGIFGGGAPYHYAPSGPLDRFVEGHSMDAITVDSVVETVAVVWNAISRAGK